MPPEMVAATGTPITAIVQNDVDSGVGTLNLSQLAEIVKMIPAGRKVMSAPIATPIVSTASSLD